MRADGQCVNFLVPDVVCCAQVVEIAVFGVL